MSKIFISYGRQDALEFAQKLADCLKVHGYDLFLDKQNGIVAGEPFDIRLEKGITDCSLLIALISPWSIRQESYCRNEWLFALSLKKPIIPVRLANINPPLIIINLHYEDAFENPEQVLSKLIPIIEDVALKGRQRYREWVLYDEKKSWWANREKLNFEGELKLYAESFVGREWFFKMLSDWIKESNEQIALIIADTGLGKSAIAAHLTTRLNTRSVHFCTSSNIETCKPVEWLKDVIYQLAAQFDIFRMEIDKKTTEPNWGVSPETLFRSLVVDPLFKNEDDYKLNEPWVFVIDSLDESLSTAGPALADLLASSVYILPKWIKIVVTCRPDQTLISKFRIEGVRHLILDSADPRNKNDLHRYIEKRLNRILENVDQESLAETIDRIADLSEGNFQYAKVLIDSLLIQGDAEIVNPMQLERFPLNLGGLYNQVFRKRFRDINHYRNVILPLINCLIESKEPLREEFLKKSSKLDENAANSALLELSQFLNRTDSGLRFFHKSIIDWLSDLTLSTEFAASRLNGKQLLTDSCWIEFKENPQCISDYCKKHLSIHLAETQKWDELIEAVKNSDLNLIRNWTDGGQTETGIKSLEGIIRYLSHQKGDKVFISGLATQLARIYGLTGNNNQAYSWLNTAAKQTSIFSGRRVKAVALHELGSLSLYYRDYSKASRFYRQALLLCDLGWTKYHDEAASNLIGLATISYEKHRLSYSTSYSKKASKRAKKAGDFHHLIAAERMLGAVQKRVGNSHEASSHLDKAMVLCELSDSVQEKYKILLLQGWLELDIAAFKGVMTDKARPLFETALADARKSSDYYYTQEALLSIGWTYIKENNILDAKRIFLSIQKAADPNFHPELSAEEDSCNVNIFYLASDYTTVMESGLILLEKLNNLNMKSRQIQLLIILGAANWHTGNFDRAKHYWKEAINISKQISEKRTNLTQAGIVFCKKDPYWIPQ